MLDVFELGAIGDGDPEAYTPEELKFLVQYALQCGRSARKGRRAIAAQDDAEAFRRKVEIIHIFRGLPRHLRNRPTGEQTKHAVLMRLGNIGIEASERTLTRDYRAIGGAKFLRTVKPFDPGENTSMPFLTIATQAPSRRKR